MCRMSVTAAANMLAVVTKRGILLALISRAVEPFGAARSRIMKRVKLP